MSFSFLNPFLLFGLISIGLPILIHLLSRKNVKVVEWGAMQFLELGKRTRRKYQLEHLLLLLLRILLICLICGALARPWISGFTLFSSERERDPRALLIVLDCSLSMSRLDVDEKPLERAKEIVTELLAEPHPGDRYFLLGARDIPQPLLPGWSSDPDQIRTVLENLPPATGSANVPAALISALQQFQEIGDLNREILILSDNQAASWHRDDQKIWQRLENLYEMTPFPPRLWSLPLITESELAHTPSNGGLTSPDLFREITVTHRPVRIRTTARHFGTENITRTVHLSIDGQRLNQQSREITLTPDSPQTLQFDYLPTTAGSHLVTVEWENDDWPGDDQVHSVLQVRPQISVLFVGQNKSTDPTLTESFYLETALTSAQNPSSNENLIQLDIKPAFPSDLSELSSVDILCLANQSDLSSEQVRLLKAYLKQGGKLLLILGDQINADNWNKTVFDPEKGLTALQLKRIRTPPEQIRGGVHVEDQSLQLDWLKPFRAEEQGGLTEAVFTNWWTVELPRNQLENAEEQVPSLSTDIQLGSGDPWLLTGSVGEGKLAIITTPLNATWTNLPTKPDYVPFVHELILSVLESHNSHNLSAGQPITYQLAERENEDRTLQKYLLTTPSEEETFLYPDQQNRLIYDQTTSSGVYQLDIPAVTGKGESGTRSKEVYVVGFDPAESNPAPLTENDLVWIQQRFPWQSLGDWNELQTAMLTSTGRTELTAWILILFVLLLLGEQFLTHYLVRDAHRLESIEEAEATEEVTT